MRSARSKIIVTALALFGWFVIANVPASAEDGIVAAKPGATVATAPSSRPASGPASRTSAVTQDEARKIADATLKEKHIDVSKLQYNGTTLVAGAGGKKFWNVAYGPQPPPPAAPGGPQMRIAGGQVVVQVAVDTGEASLVMGM